MFAGTPADGQVRAIFLHEPDVDQLVRNFQTREPDAGPQRVGAAVSAQYSECLARPAAARNVPVVPARHWSTLLA